MHVLEVGRENAKKPGRRLVCLSCADALIATGGALVKDEPVTIDLGTECQTHPGGMAPAATHPVDGGTPPALETRPALETPPPPPPPYAAAADSVFPPMLLEPQGLGPVTEIAARLLVAWTKDDRGAGADTVVDAAVITARALLRATGGR